MPAWYIHLRAPLIVIQTLTATIILQRKVERKPDFELRFVKSLVLSLIICYMAQHAFYNLDRTVIGGFFRILAAAPTYLCLVAIVYYCWRDRFWNVVLSSSTGYIAADMCGSLKTLLKVNPSILALAEHPLGILLLDAICYGGGLYLIFLIAKKYIDDTDMEGTDNDRFKALFSIGVLLLSIAMPRITQDNSKRNDLAQMSESIYQITCGALWLVIQFGVFERHRMNRNMDIMRELIHQQHTQYESSKESMQLVNEKYHDLKNLLRSFRGTIPARQLEKLERSIENYDACIHAGNEVLDVLLTEKKIVCQQQNIQLTCYAGGVDYGTIEELDLYFLLGNALNNAIDAVSQLPEGRERFITLVASREGDMISIHLENPFEGEVELEDGLPKSSRDPRFHGFGMKSMERLAEKYGGAIAVKHSNKMFYLDIILFECG